VEVKFLSSIYVMDIITELELIAVVNL